MTDKVSRTEPVFKVNRTRFQDKGAYEEIRYLIEQLSSLRRNLAGGILDVRSVVQLSEGAKSSDPDDPSANSCVLWQSDGTASGDDGDIMMKITDSGGTTKTTTLVDFSAI